MTNQSHTELAAPSVPEDVLTYIHAYGDSRADDDGLSGLRIAEAILAIRRWAAALKSHERVQGEACPICFADEPYTGTCGSNDPRALCNLVPTPPTAPAQDAQGWTHWEARIKSLMGQVGLPNSRSLYQAFAQLAREIEAATPSPQAEKQPLSDEQIDALPWGPHEGNPITFAEGLRDFARAIEAAHGIVTKEST